MHVQKQAKKQITCRIKILSKIFLKNSFLNLKVGFNRRTISHCLLSDKWKVTMHYCGYSVDNCFLMLVFLVQIILMTNWSMVFDGTSLWHSSNDFIRDKIKFVVYIICNDIWCDSTNIKNIIMLWFWVKTQWNIRYKIIIMHVCVWQRNFASFK